MLSEVVRQRIRRIRAQRYLTQEALCDRAGISIDAVSRIEGGSRVPSLDTLEKLAEALGVSVVDLVRTQPLPRPGLAPAIQRTVNLLEHQPLWIQHAAEKVLKTVVDALSSAKNNSADFAAESHAPYSIDPE